MIRRPLLAATALVAALALSSCATFTSNQHVASVGDASLSRDEFASMLDSSLGQTLLNDAPANGSISGDSARGLIQAWIGITAFTQAGIGADVDRAAVEKDLATQLADQWTDAPDVLRELAIDNTIIGQLLSDGTITREDLQAAAHDADIWVDSRYGWWDRDGFGVKPFG